MQNIALLAVMLLSLQSVCVRADTRSDSVHADAQAARYEDRAETMGRVVTLIQERLALMPDVAAVKWISRAAVNDPAREAHVLDNVVARATQLGLDADTARALFALLIRFARDVQTRLHEDWTRSGRCGPCASVSGLTGLRERIDAIDEDLLLTLLLMSPPPAQTSDAGELERKVAATWGVSIPGADDRKALLDAIRSVRRLGGDSWNRIHASGMLRIGTTGDYAPFSLESAGELRGADIALARDLARHLKLRPVYVRTSWPTLVQDLRDDRFDVALSGISFTPERAAVGKYSVPYQRGGKTILARCVQRQDFETLAEVDRPGVKVVVNPGGTNERYVREALHRATIVLHPDNTTTFDEIMARRADVMITDDVEVDLQSRRHPELCRTMPGTLTQGDKRVLMVRDDRLHAAVDIWLSSALDAGLPQQLLQQAMIDAVKDSPR